MVLKMAEVFSTLVHSIQPAQLWCKLRSFCRGEFRENENGCQKHTPNTESSQPAAAMLDHESGLHLQQEAAVYNDPADNTRPPSSPAPHSDQNPPPTQEGLNPIARIFKERDLGKTIISFVMPLTGAFLTPYAPTSLLVRKLVLLSLSLGFALLWNGILLVHAFPRYANIIEQIGAALVLMAVYGLISSFLPDYLFWIPWACFLMVLLPIFWSYFWHQDQSN